MSAAADADPADRAARSFLGALFVVIMFTSGNVTGGAGWRGVHDALLRHRHQGRGFNQGQPLPGAHPTDLQEPR